MVYISKLYRMKTIFVGWPMNSLGTNASNWSGTWSGLLKIYPNSGRSIETLVTWEIGPYPTVINICTPWRNTYSENGTLKLKKDYRFCREQGSNVQYIDESDGTKIVAQWIDNVLVHPFTYNGLIGVNLIRMRGNNLEEEKLTFEDKPLMNGVISMKALTIECLIMTRVSTKKQNQLFLV